MCLSLPVLHGSLSLLGFNLRCSTNFFLMSGNMHFPFSVFECFFFGQGLRLNLVYYVPFPLGQLMCALQHRVGILFLLCVFTLQFIVCVLRRYNCITVTGCMCI